MIATIEDAMKTLSRYSASRIAATHWIVFALSAAVAGCEGSDPQTTAGAATGTGGSSAATMADGGSGGATASPASGPGGAGGSVEPPLACEQDEGLLQNNGADCAAQPGDYVPNTEDGYAKCVSDDDPGSYSPIDVNISTLARVAAFEKIATLLGFGTARAPTPQDFLDARVEYTLAEGLESRVTRREDEHYPPAPDACNKLPAGEVAKHPDRCVGPARIAPLLNEAFKAGTEGNEPALNAVRIEAALLWFLYVSVHKEAVTCSAKDVDCDSSYAYYTGGSKRADEGLGLSRYVKARSTQAHDRIWDGILAVRCWRALDPGTPPTELSLRDMAIGQLDRALLRGVAVIVLQRLDKLPCVAAGEFVRILGPVLVREAEARDPASAAIIAAEFAKSDAREIDRPALSAAIESAFACP